jgi:heme/copper-type cytochrome/quinol oxidase subunit 4
MAPFMTLIFLLVLATVGFVFDLYLFSHGAFGNRYSKRTKFTRSLSTDPMMNNEDDYEFYACSDKMYERPQHNAHTVLVVLFAVIMVVGMVLFMLINAFAG